MASRSRLSIAKPKIELYFNNSKNKIYSSKNLENIFISKNLEWRLAASTTVKNFIEFLTEKSKLKVVKLNFPSQTITRYIWGEENIKYIYDIALSLKPQAYLSHYSAVFFHNLTEQIPKNIFITFEQPQKSYDRDSLTQEKINEAFKKPVRETTNIAQFGDFNITLLNGQFTKQAGVLKTEKDGTIVSMTNIERTLIDIAVRPNYSGGVLEVLKAFKISKETVQISKLKAYLKQINFIYPYHQVIGFYLEQIGIPDKRLAYIEDNFEKNFDFYLAHNMKDMLYSKRWRLYYPSIIKSVD